MDIVIQAAATTSGAMDIVNSPYMHVTDNAIMNSLILRSCFENSIKHFIFPSCTVMYQPSEKAIKESDFSADQELLPNYFGVGNTKLYIEKMCEFYARISDIRFTVIRHSNIYGPHDKFDLKRSHVFGATVSKVMTAEKKVMVWGDGSEKRDLLYVDDLCSFVDMSIINQKSQFEVFNCGLGEAVSIRELVERIIIHSGKNLEIEYDLSRPSIKTSLFLSNEKATKCLNWSPETKLDDGIKKTLKWWQDYIDPATLLLKGPKNAG